MATGLNLGYVIISWFLYNWRLKFLKKVYSDINDCVTEFPFLAQTIIQLEIGNWIAVHWMIQLYPRSYSYI